jgi:hypothetical protein
VSQHRHIPEPGELVYSPKPSWAPVFIAIGATGLVCGIFAAGFIFPPKVYMVVGALLVLAALNSAIRGAVRTYFRLPRRQRTRGAALPVETITLDD